MYQNTHWNQKKKKKEKNIANPIVNTNNKGLFRILWNIVNWAFYKNSKLWKLLIIFVRSFLLAVWQISEYSSKQGYCKIKIRLWYLPIKYFLTRSYNGLFCWYSSLRRFYEVFVLPEQIVVFVEKWKAVSDFTVEKVL